MAARDGASSVNGNWLRVTKLTTAGNIDTTYPVLNTRGFITASFSPEYEDGDEINEKAADGTVCVTWKGDDSLTRLSFSLSVCTPDPEITALLAGGSVVRDGSNNIIGYSSVPVQSAVGSPVAIEIWSTANIGGKPDATQPYWHWVFPYVKVRYDGDREFANGLLSNEYTGQALGNDALLAAGLNPADGAGSDFVKYRTALTNPFTYIRTTGVPNNLPLFSGSWPVSGSAITPS